MKKHNLLFLAFCCLLNTQETRSQERKINLTDSLNSPISFATVWFHGSTKQMGVYSDSNGNFHLPEVDSISISHICYQPLTLFKEEIRDTIKLEANNLILDEIIVLSEHDNKTEKSKNLKRRLKYFLTVSGIEIGRIFSFNFDNKKLLTKLIIPCQFPSNYHAIMRLNVRSVKNGIPDSLLSSDVIDLASRNKNNLTFDLTSKNLTVDQEILFFSIEILGYKISDKVFDSLKDFKEAFQVYLDFEGSENLTYISRVFAEDKEWIKEDPAYFRLEEKTVNLMMRIEFR